MLAPLLFPWLRSALPHFFHSRIATVYISTNLENKIFAQIIDWYLFCYSSIKFFERILYDRVYFYLPEYQLLSKYQFGFRPRSSTSHAVESIDSNLLSNADNGLYSCSIFLDLSKAGVSNIRPKAQIRPVAWLDPARGMILWNKNFFFCLRSLSSYTSITGDYRFQLLATLT